MATRADFASIETELLPFVDRIESYESGYLATHRRYWQGIKTPTITPEDGARTPPTRRIKPTDQAETWEGLETPADVPCSIEVHTHNGPLGQGFTVILTGIIGGETWRRSFGTGAHGMTRDWIRVV